MPATPRLPLRLLAVSTVLALLAAIATYVLLSGGDDDQVDAGSSTVDLTPEDPEAGDPSSVSFTTFEGEEVPLRSLQGGPVLVNFFASYCTPCIEEMPALEEVHQELGDQVTFLGLAMQDRPEDALALIERTGITYRTGQDKDSSVITALGGIVLPTTVLLDADGQIVASHSGELTADDIRGLIADAFGIQA